MKKKIWMGFIFSSFIVMALVFLAPPTWSQRQSAEDPVILSAGERQEIDLLFQKQLAEPLRKRFEESAEITRAVILPDFYSYRVLKKNPRDSIYECALDKVPREIMMSRAVMRKDGSFAPRKANQLEIARFKADLKLKKIFIKNKKGDFVSVEAWLKQS